MMHMKTRAATEVSNIQQAARLFGLRFKYVESNEYDLLLKDMNRVAKPMDPNFRKSSFILI